MLKLVKKNSPSGIMAMLLLFYYADFYRAMAYICNRDWGGKCGRCSNDRVAMAGTGEGGYDHHRQVFVV